MAEHLKTILRVLLGLGIFAFWIWSIENNDGFFAIGIPILFICYAASTSDDKGPRGGHAEPRIAPYDGDSGG